MYKEMEGGHLVPLIGQDMSYFTEDAMELIYKYHPLDSTQDKESTFKFINENLEDFTQ